MTIAPLKKNEFDLFFDRKVLEAFPKYQELDKEFSKDSNPLNRFVCDIFYNGGTLPKVKAGIDGPDARFNFKVLLMSWTPKHEHKLALGAWMLNEWFITDEIIGVKKENDA